MKPKIRLPFDGHFPITFPFGAISDNEEIKKKFHEWGISIYAHLKALKVKLHIKVRAGKVIGLSGNSGSSFGQHLHFGIKLNKTDPNNGYLGFIDPSPFF